MFRARTLLVLGAGASHEVGLPVGSQLLEEISRALDISFEWNRQISGDAAIVQALRDHLNEGTGVDLLNAHITAGRQLRRSAEQALSIDNVIDGLENPFVERIGKLAILRCILQAEAGSAYFKAGADDRSGISVGKFSDTWYSRLSTLLTENVRRSQIDGIFANLEIVNFNYDRCLEQYLPFSLANYYGEPVERFQSLLRQVPMHRPYGSAGPLPDQPLDNGNVPFGSLASHSLLRALHGIRTFTEQLDEGGVVSEIREAVGRADRIVFLGFGYHRQNLELLSAPIQDHAEILGTACGISPDDVGVIKRELAVAFGYRGDTFESQRAYLTDATCCQLFDSHRRTLTAALDVD